MGKKYFIILMLITTTYKSGNENSAEVSRINTTATKMIIYVSAAALYGVAGFLLGAKAGGSSVNLGLGYELKAFAGYKTAEALLVFKLHIAVVWRKSLL